MERYSIVEKKSPNVCHGIFYSLEGANKHLEETIPKYIAKGYFTDKTLTVDDFKVIERGLSANTMRNKR